MKEWDRNLNLIRELVIKDLKIRYSRPVLGFLWAFLTPFLMVMIFYFVFGTLLKVKTEDVPFFLYLMSGVFPWVFFQESITRSATSLMDNKSLIKESRFPHYLVPISIVVANMINYLPPLFILITSSSFILKGLPALLWLLPFILALHFLITIGLSIIVSILYIRWRDLKYFLDAVLMLLFYLTPTCYSLLIVKNSFPAGLFKAYLYNPLVGILTFYRTVLFKGFAVEAGKWFNLYEILTVQIVFVAVIFVSAFYIYKSNKNSINDYLPY